MKKLQDFIRCLPGGNISVSWSWDLGPKPRGTIEKGWKRFLPFLRFPGSRIATGNTVPPSVAVRDLAHEELADISGQSPTFEPEKQPMKYPDIFPQANQSHRGAFNHVGSFHDNSPCGVTVHYTATRDISATIKELAKRGLGYHIIIDRDGTIYQCTGLLGRLHHAGRATWRGRSPNRAHLAVALISWGWVTLLAPGAFQSWSKHLVPTDDCAKRRGVWWDAATAAQVHALIRFLRWSVEHGIEVDDICGHDECCKPRGRKVDPGGVLPYTMGELRELLDAPLVVVS